MSAPGRLDLFGDVVKALESQVDLNKANLTAFDTLRQSIDSLWQNNADLRDELHALSNRLEALTRAVARDAA